MKWVRFSQEGMICWGQLEDEVIVVHSGHPFEPCHHATLERLPLADVPLLAPVAPSKIVCVGRNYREHARELGHDVPVTPLLFLKSPSAIIAHGEAIVIPRPAQRVDHEGELAVVIGRRCRGLNQHSRISDYIFGYTCLNDVTARDLQKADGQWTRAKGFDSFCPLGPWI